MISTPLPPLLKLQIAVAWECLKEDTGTLAHAHRVRPDHPDGRAILDDIRRSGFHVLRGYYGRSACAELAGEIDAIVAAHPDRIEIDEQGSDHRIWGSEKASGRIRAVHDDPTLSSFAASYLGTRAANITTLGAKLLARPENKGSGGGWHRDSMFEKQFKAIVYLNDVTEQNGPFQFLAGSNTRRSVLGTLGYSCGKANLKRFDDQDIEGLCRTRPGALATIAGSAGDVILVDTRGIHRGRPIEAGTRYALTNYYSSAHRYDVLSPGFVGLIKF